MTIIAIVQTDVMSRAQARVQIYCATEVKQDLSSHVPTLLGHWTRNSSTMAFATVVIAQTKLKVIQRCHVKMNMRNCILKAEKMRRQCYMSSPCVAIVVCCKCADDLNKLLQTPHQPMPCASIHSKA
jgi:hypothetical protein